MAEKIGSGFARDMVDRGRRELGGVFYGDSNIAQPMYPLRSGIEPVKDPHMPDSERERSMSDERLDRPVRDEPGRDGPEPEGPEFGR